MPTKRILEPVSFSKKGRPMTASDAQVRIIMRERRKGRTQEQAAVKANIGSRRTVRKYEA